MDLDAHENVYVADPGNGRIQIFTAEGKPAPYIPMDFPLNSIKVLNSADILENLYSSNYSLTDLSLMDSLEQIPLIRVINPEGKTLRYFGAPNDHGDKTANFEANKYLFTTNFNDNVFLAYKYKNLVEKYAMW